METGHSWEIECFSIAQSVNPQFFLYNLDSCDCYAHNLLYIEKPVWHDYNNLKLSYCVIYDNIGSDVGKTDFE